MGQHMARHIYSQLEPKDELFVYDTNPSAATAFVDNVTKLHPNNGSKLHQLNSLSDFPKQHAPMDFIVTMVPEGKHVNAVVSELVSHYKETPTTHPLTIIDSSTISIPESRVAAELVKSEIPHFEFIDTPVSGGVAGARKGTLTFMVSKQQDSAITPQLNTLLKKMGKNIFACGAASGSGLAAKLANNYCLAVTNLAVCDAFQLANAFGLDVKKFADIVAVSTGKSWASVDNCPIPGVYPENELPADVNYKGGFVTKLTRKDLTIAMDCAKEYHRPLYLGETSKYWYDKACERDDLANRDLGVLYEYLGQIEEDASGKLVDTHLAKK
jgi:3-hydroxyisobutyrate dehydrogenase